LYKTANPFGGISYAMQLFARIIAILFLTSAIPMEAATLSEWRHDVDQIVNDIRIIHPSPFTKTGELTFRRRVAALQGTLPSMTDEQRVVEMMRIVAMIGDGHTSLFPDQPAFALWYPLRVYELTDGYFVTSAHKSVADLAGAQIIGIAGHPIAEVAARARELVGCDNELDCKELLAPLHNAALMRGLGFAAADGTLAIRVKLANGATVDRVLTPHATDDPRYEKNDSSFDWRFRREVFGTPISPESDWIAAYRGIPASAFRTFDPARPPHLTQARSFFTKSIPESEAYYIQSYAVDENGFGAGFPKALAEVDRLKPRRLIVDLRYNFGGDGSLIPAVIHEFIRREAAPPWKELYLLTGRKTFSAGVEAAAMLMKNCDLTVIGEPMGAALNSYGDAAERDYPRTGLRLYVSSLRHELSTSNDLAETTRIDVPAQFSFREWSAGQDPAVDPILRGDEMRSIRVIARAAGGAAARKAYDDRKARFAGVRWWQPPPEIELRQTCSQLLAENRVADGLDVCTLNSEVHPFIWNTWLNLARAQSAAGLMLDRLRSLKRVLEIDPTNFNRDEIEKAFAAGLRPPVIRFGAKVADIQAALAGSCSTINLREINPPFLDDVKQKQMQIDCEGFPFLGGARHAEFVFRDDSLEMVWIMTTPAEQESIRVAMHEAYGEVSIRNARYEAFVRARAALRVKPAEVLFYSEGMAKGVEEEFR
jgi:hypothetical protein